MTALKKAGNDSARVGSKAASRLRGVHGLARRGQRRRALGVGFARFMVWTRDFKVAERGLSRGRRVLFPDCH